MSNLKINWKLEIQDLIIISLGVLCDRLVQTTMDSFYSQRDTPFCGFEGARLEILPEDLLCYCNAFCVSRWGRKRIALSLGS